MILLFSIGTIWIPPPVCRLAIDGLECVVHPPYPFRLPALLFTLSSNASPLIVSVLSLVLFALACSPVMYYELYDSALMVGVLVGTVDANNETDTSPSFSRGPARTRTLSRWAIERSIP
jgi:hypothetical protein